MQSILLGDAEVVVSDGMESMSLRFIDEVTPVTVQLGKGKPARQTS